MKQRIIPLFVILSLCLTMLFGCAAQEEESNPEVEAYIQSAQILIDQGDLESAIAVLKQAFAETNDASLAVKLEEVRTMLEEAESTEESEEVPTESTVEVTESSIEETQEETVAPETTQTPATTQPPETTSKPQEALNLWNYAGGWGSSGFSWTDGGYYLSIEVMDLYPTLTFYSVSSAPYNRNAMAEFSVTTNDITGDAVYLYFSNDGWGNSGYLTLYFGDGYIYYTITNDHLEGGSMWGLYDAEGTLTQISYGGTG